MGKYVFAIIENGDYNENEIFDDMEFAIDLALENIIIAVLDAETHVLLGVI